MALNIGMEQELNNSFVPSVETPLEWVYYVYGVTSRSSKVGYPELGIDKEHSTESVMYNSLLAITSRVSYKSFNQDVLKQRMGDRVWLETFVRRHTSIVNAIHSDEGLIPMRFLTLCKDKEEVEGFLQENELMLKKMLDTVRGTQEWGVKVFCNDDKLRRIVMDNEVRFSPKARETSKSRVGTSFLLQKKKARQAQESLARICIECKEECHSRLVALAREAKIVEVEHSEYSGRLGTMVFNGAYLVRQEQANDFQKTITWLSEQFNAQGFEIVLSGPWPPYHFVKHIA